MKTLFTEETRVSLQAVARGISEARWWFAPFEKWTGAFDWDEPSEHDDDDRKVAKAAEKLVAAVQKKPLKWSEQLPNVRVQWHIGTGLVEVHVQLVRGKVVFDSNDLPKGRYTTLRAAASAVNKAAKGRM